MTVILAMGDIMGKAGRRCLDTLLPKLRAEFKPDIVIANGENAAGGFGMTEKIYKDFVDSYGIDCVMMGNHWHDKREIYDYFPRAEKMVLPANMANVEREEMGLKILTAQNGTRFAAINLLGKAFMHGENRCPFKAVDKLLSHVPPAVKIRIVDMHAEASSEKQAMGWHCTGRASLVYGTHTHVPTADERVLGGKTGFLTDLGMTGGYDSVIGIRKDAAIARLVSGEKRKWEPATGDPWLTAVVAEIDDQTGWCKGVKRLRWELSEPASQDEKDSGE